MTTFQTSASNNIRVSSNIGNIRFANLDLPQRQQESPAGRVKASAITSGGNYAVVVGHYIAYFTPNWIYVGYDNNNWWLPEGEFDIHVPEYLRLDAIMDVMNAYELDHFQNKGKWNDARQHFCDHSTACESGVKAFEGIVSDLARAMKLYEYTGKMTARELHRWDCNATGELTFKDYITIAETKLRLLQRKYPKNVPATFTLADCFAVA